MKKTKRPEFEPAEYLHKNWVTYTSKHANSQDVEALLPLLNDSSPFARTEAQVLDALYNATLLVLESAPHLDTAQKTRAIYFEYNLCSCDACQNDCGAHINKKGQIRISQKFFQDTLQSPPPNGLLELMYTLLHQMLHGIFPELDEKTVTEQTEQTWKSGMSELTKNKLNSS